jgi:hypothetical protein
LQCFDAVVPEAAFSPLRKSCGAQPTVFAAVKSLEVQFGLNHIIEGYQWRAESPHLWRLNFPHLGGHGDQPLM